MTVSTISLLSTVFTSDSGKTITELSIGEAALYALLGYLVVFAGIAIIMGIVYLVGFILRKVTAAADTRKAKKAEEEAKKAEADAAAAADGESGDITELERAAVIAAVYAVLSGESGSAPKAEFVVRRIKRL